MYLGALQAETQEQAARLSEWESSQDGWDQKHNQLQSTLQATQAELQQANALNDAERLQVTLLQEAAAAREAAVQLLTQQLQDTEDRLKQQGQQLQVSHG